MKKPYEKPVLIEYGKFVNDAPKTGTKPHKKKPGGVLGRRTEKVLDAKLRQN